MARRHDLDAVTADGTVFSTLSELGVVPVVTIDRVDRAEPLGEALLAGGLPCAEITFRTAAAADAIGILTRVFPQMLVGAGTVLSVEQAEAAVASGARFVVSPVLDETVVSWCLANDVPVAPGVMTPTEVAAAATWGLGVAKFFPASSAGGPAALEAIATVFPQIGFIPTGGIGPDDLSAYLRLPTVVACGGSWPAPRQLIDDGDFGRIEQLTAATVAAIQVVRGGT